MLSCRYVELFYTLTHILDPCPAFCAPVLSMGSNPDFVTEHALLKDLQARNELLRTNLPRTRFEKCTCLYFRQPFGMMLFIKGYETSRHWNYGLFPRGSCQDSSGQSGQSGQSE